MSFLGSKVNILNSCKTFSCQALKGILPDTCKEEVIENFIIESWPLHFQNSKVLYNGNFGNGWIQAFFCHKSWYCEKKVYEKLQIACSPWHSSQVVRKVCRSIVKGDWLALRIHGEIKMLVSAGIGEHKAVVARTVLFSLIIHQALFIISFTYRSQCCKIRAER